MQTFSKTKNATMAPADTKPSQTAESWIAGLCPNSKIINDHYKLSTTFARLLTNINTKLFDKANEVIHVLAPLLGASTD